MPSSGWACCSTWLFYGCVGAQVVVVTVAVRDAWPTGTLNALACSWPPGSACPVVDAGHLCGRPPSSGASSTPPEPSPPTATPSPSPSTAGPTHPFRANPTSAPTPPSLGGKTAASASSSADQGHNSLHGNPR